MVRGSEPTSSWTLDGHELPFVPLPASSRSARRTRRSRVDLVLNAARAEATAIPSNESTDRYYCSRRGGRIWPSRVMAVAGGASARARIPARRPAHRVQDVGHAFPRQVLPDVTHRCGQRRVGTSYRVGPGLVDRVPQVSRTLEREETRQQRLRVKIARHQEGCMSTNLKRRRSSLVWQAGRGHVHNHSIDAGIRQQQAGADRLTPTTWEPRGLTG
jgi:hypothetical protein